MKGRNYYDESTNGAAFTVPRIANEPEPLAAAFVRLHDGSPLQADEFCWPTGNAATK